MMFTKVLIANRGEVAIRINATLERLGIAAVGVYTPTDHRSLHVKRIAECILLNDARMTGYLDRAQIIAAAKTCGADAIHPGYGFLAENADFAAACESAGLVFIGPQAEAIAALGEKISARQLAEQAGVPVVPGISSPNMSDQDLLDACRSLEFPLLVKPAAGGGGKGLHIAHTMDELGQVLPVARREARAAFGDDTLFVEKYLLHARHIEFQVAADNYGNVVHLGERECSLQRRHQKVVEEAPSALLSDKQRKIMGDAAIKLTSAINYRNLGTIEFLVDDDSPDIFCFMEMNTRLQVEHRVTEMVTGLDLVECQLRLAAGEPLQDVIPAVRLNGHAVEARIYAEDAFNGFLPTGGVIGKFVVPVASHTITDSGISDDAVVSSSFDPMLAKIVCWAEDREPALEHLHNALTNTVLLGVTTNIDFLIRLLDAPAIRTAKYDTQFLENLEIQLGAPSPEVLAAYASLASVTNEIEPWRRDGWRLAGSPPATIAGFINGVRYDAALPSDSNLVVDCYRDDDNFWIHHASFGTWQVKRTTERQKSADQLSDAIVSPMPGVVIAVKVAIGEEVSVGDPLVVIEAMKMEHIVRARHAGRIAKCHIDVGSNVRVGQLLLEVVENV
jgi:acetyl-CoA/propionyl-CoA carboxylase biotin carboxyl carrier protein